MSAAAMQEIDTAWCVTCRSYRTVVERHEEAGDPDHTGSAPLYAVADLACGHTNEHRIIGASSWVL